MSGHAQTRSMEMKPAPGPPAVFQLLFTKPLYNAMIKLKPLMLQLPPEGRNGAGHPLWEITWD